MKLRALTLTLVLGVCAVMSGQEFTGRVSDPSGASLPKATVIAHNLLTNEDVTTHTSNTGDYTIPYLKAGEYSLTASSGGFATLVKDHITLEVGKTGVINFALLVGTASEVITVDANVALDAGKADRGEVVENTRVTELPLNGRDPEMLSILNAGVTWTGSPQYQRPFDSTQSNLSVNGGGAGNNVLQVDGVTNDAGNGNGIVGYVPPVDSVQEFKIITNPYDAQYGRGQGGVEDITLKSGTNRIHGDVYEFARRTWLDADTWQNDYANSISPGVSPKGQHKLDQYGAELDGPIVVPHLYNGRDKSFFLLQYENWNEVVPNTLITSVPDPSWLKGDFSNLTYWTGSAYAPITIYDPLTIHNVNGTMVRDPFPGNIIPADRINAGGLNLLSYYPKPNLTPPPGTNPFANNYVTPNPTTDLYRNVLSKWDENFGQKDRFSLRFGYWERWETRSDNGMPGLAASGSEPFGQHGPTFTADWVHTFTPSLVFDFRGSVIVRYNGYNNGPQNFNVASLGWNSSALLGTHMPRMSINEFAPLGNGGANIDVENTAAILPSITWVKGSHTLHMGADIRDYQQAFKDVEQGPSFYVDRQWTQSNYIGSQWNQYSGNSVAAMLLGYTDNGSTNNVSQTYYTRHYIAPFIQDDWKVSHKLTLNLGVRYDVNTPAVERHNRVDYAFSTTMVNPIDSQVNHALIPGGAPVKGGITFAGVNGNPRSYYATDWTNVQPRVGFAYAATSKIVVRGGVGEMFKNPIPGGNTLGYSSSTTFNATYDGGQTPADTLSNPFPNGVVQPAGASLGAYTGLGQGPWFINPNYKTPGIWQYSFGIQQQFLRADTLEISYAGTHGFHQDSSDNINHWDPSYQAKCDIELGGNHHICDDASPGYITNPFLGLSAFSGSSYATAPTIQLGNMTRPYVAFGDVIEYQLNDGRTTYNSLQVTGIHRQGRNLTLHGTWTWSKLMDYGGFADETYRIKAHSIDGNDFTHRVTLSGVYDLPVGRGQAILGNLNRVADLAIGGWELGTLFIYQTGSPWGVPSGLEYVGNAMVSKHLEGTTSGYRAIRGVKGCVASTDAETGLHTLYQNNWTAQNSCGGVADFIVRPPYAATQNVAYTGIRLPSSYQFDTNLSKNFAIHEDLKLQFRLEAFNVLNHPLWQDGYDGTPSDSTFGSIAEGPSGQSNLPRQVQIALKLLW